MPLSLLKYTTIILAFLCLLALYGAVPESVSAQAVTNLVGAQLGSTINPGPWSCNRSPAYSWGAARYTPNITAGWSGLAQKASCKEWMVFYEQDMGQTDFFERFKFSLANKPIPAETDIRVCVQEKNGSSYGPETCTPWASSGVSNQWLDSGFSGGPMDPDGIRLKVYSRKMPGRSILDMQIRGRFQDNYFPYGNVVGAWQATPWRSAGGGWTGVITGSGPAWGFANSVEISARFKLTPLPPPPALPDLVGTIGNLGTLTVGQSYPVAYGVRNIGTAAVAPGTRIQLQFDYKRDNWDGCGVDGDFCVGTTAGALAVGAAQSLVSNHTFTTPGNWFVRAVADPGPSQIAESNELNNTSTWDDFVTVASPLSATLSRCNATTDTGGCSSGSSGWTTGNMTIITGHTIKLRWSSTNATTCSGSNFSTGGATSNSSGVTPLTVPTSGSPVPYTLTCNDTNASTPAATSRVTVTANDVAPELTTSETTVHLNDPFTLTWNLNGNDPAQCTITGPGSAYTAAGSITTQTGNTTINATGTATYTLDCPGGDSAVSIQVLPQIFET